MAKEIWKRVPGFPNYEMSITGRVRSLKFGKVILLAYSENMQGYAKVTLSHKGKSKTFRVARLLWATWHGSISDAKQINHIDGNKKNNHVKNLELVTGLANMRHASKLKLLGNNDGEINGAAKLTWAKVIQIREQAKNLSHRKLAKLFGVSASNIGVVLSGRTWRKNKMKLALKKKFYRS